MENNSSYDLSAAIRAWLEELAVQPHLAPDDLRELETHLRDTIAELRAQGLNDEESFLLATHRVGQPRKLAEEFVKTDPALLWRERAFWVVVAMLGVNMWQRAIGIVTQALMRYLPLGYLSMKMNHFTFTGMSQMILFDVIILVLTGGPYLYFAIRLSRGRMPVVETLMRSLLSSRSRFISRAMIPFGMLAAASILAQWLTAASVVPEKWTWFMYLVTSSVPGLIWDFALVALAASLMPGADENRPRIKIVWR